MPTDPGVLARIGNIYLKEEDEAHAFHYHQEAYRYFPVNMNVISWLGAYFVKNEMYEKAVAYFERAAQASSRRRHHRRRTTAAAATTAHLPPPPSSRRADPAARGQVEADGGVVPPPLRRLRARLRHLPDDPAEFPDNVERLRYLVHICDDLGKKDQVHEYAVKLRKAERALDAMGGGADTRRRADAAAAGRPAAARLRPRLPQRECRHNTPPPEKPYVPGDSEYENHQVARAGESRTPQATKKVTAANADDDHFADVAIDDELLPRLGRAAAGWVGGARCVRKILR